MSPTSYLCSTPRYVCDLSGVRTRDLKIKSPLRYQLRHEARTTADPMTGPAGINIYI